MTLDERKTLTKVSTRKPLTNIPQTKAHTSERENQKIICKTRKLVKGPDTAKTSKKLFATSPVVSRKKRFLTDIIGLGIQAFSAISQHRKQNKLEKSMKHLKHRQDALDHKIEALEDDMISITKETFEELDYLRRELELTGYNIKVLTAEIKRVEYELSKHV